MTEHDPDDRELTPEQEAHVRRLLADARHHDPTPDAVAARLDRVLTDLAGEPLRAAAVVRLADRRRRVATVLVAAAASVAAVIGVGQIVSNTDGGADTSSAEQDGISGERPAAGSDQNGYLAGQNGTSSHGESYGGAGKRMPYELQSDQFARDADALQLEALASTVTDGRTGVDLPEFSAKRLNRVKNRSVCDPGAWGGGNYVAVLYDDAEGWMVLRRPRGETQIADLFLCGSESVVRSVTLTYPRP